MERPFSVRIRGIVRAVRVLRPLLLTERDLSPVSDVIAPIAFIRGQNRFPLLHDMLFWMTHV